MAGNGNVADDIGVDDGGVGDTTGMAGNGNVAATNASRDANFSPLEGLGVDDGNDTPGDNDPVVYGCDVLIMAESY